MPGLAKKHLKIEALVEQARSFEHELKKKKYAIRPEAFWYPYGGAMSNLYNLAQILTGQHRDLKNLLTSDRIVDIGGADGDMSFFMESLGFSVDLVDNPSTNNNGLEGARLAKEALSSSVQIKFMDLDQQFQLEEHYGLCFFLGILYHLKNPFYVMERLASHTKYMFLSTRIARLTPDKRTDIKDYPLAYLVGPLEANGDPTNYWMFSETGLRQLIFRTGWEICDFGSRGNVKDSDPASPEGDERVFCLLRSSVVK